VKPQVLQQDEARGRRSGHHPLGLGADAVARERHFGAQQLAEPRRDRPQAHFRVGFSLRPPQVRGQHHARRAFVERVRDGRQRGADAGVVADHAAVERDVEIHPHEHAPAVQAKGADGSFSHSPRATTFTSRSMHRFE
jgi:hypothetical protein